MVELYVVIRCAPRRNGEVTGNDGVECWVESLEEAKRYIRAEAEKEDHDYVIALVTNEFKRQWKEYPR